LIAGGLAAAVAVAAAVIASRPTTPAPAATTEAVVTSAAPTASAVVEEKASIVFESDPPGAAIWINGDLRTEVTPATIANLPIGKDIQVKLSMEGFESHKETVRLAKAGDSHKITSKLLTGSVTLELDVVPEPVVWVDGKPWKGDWRKITVSADEEHKLAISATGYAPKTITVTGKKGETKKLQHALVKLTPEQLADQKKEPDNKKPDAKPEPKAGAMGTIRVNVKGGGFCNVSINGAAYGPTPVSAQVPAGNVRVSCKFEGGPTQAQVVTVAEGGTGRASFQQ
jgi:serine/threonine-protein kinase